MTAHLGPFERNDGPHFDERRSGSTEPPAVICHTIVTPPAPHSRKPDWSIIMPVPSKTTMRQASLGTVSLSLPAR